MEFKTMKEYPLPELGYFTESECRQIKKLLDGVSFMKFEIGYSNYAGNCTLIVKTDYDVSNLNSERTYDALDIPRTEETERVKNFFLNVALGTLADLTY